MTIFILILYITKIPKYESRVVFNTNDTYTFWEAMKIGLHYSIDEKGSEFFFFEILWVYL